MIIQRVEKFLSKKVGNKSYNFKFFLIYCNSDLSFLNIKRTELSMLNITQIDVNFTKF